MAMGIPLDLQEVRIGLNNLVKRYGADDKPKGKTANWKYFTAPSPKTQEKAKYFRWSEKNFDMMVPRLKVELEKIKSFRENLKSYGNVFTPKFPFENMQIDVPQIKN